MLLFIFTLTNYEFNIYYYIFCYFCRCFPTYYTSYFDDFIT